MDEGRWPLPVPPEHGAKTLVLVGLGTPVSVALGIGIPLTRETLVLYLPFCGIGVGGLLFREAIRTSLRSRPEDSRPVGRFIAVEGIGLAVLSGALVVGHHPAWGVLVLLIPVIAVEAWVSRHRQANPLLKAVIGVFVIGGLVPAGLLLLGETDPGNAGVVYVLFLGYHLLAVLRVAAGVGALGSVPTIALLVPTLAVLFTAFGYLAGMFGPGTPIVFGLSALRSGQLERRAESPSLKHLGQAEAMLSLAFVLAGPFLLG